MHPQLVNTWSELESLIQRQIECNVVYGFTPERLLETLHNRGCELDLTNLEVVDATYGPRGRRTIPYTDIVTVRYRILSNVEASKKLKR